MNIRRHLVLAALAGFAASAGTPTGSADANDISWDVSCLCKSRRDAYFVGRVLVTEDNLLEVRARLEEMNQQGISGRFVLLNNKKCEEPKFCTKELRTLNRDIHHLAPATGQKRIMVMQSNAPLAVDGKFDTELIQPGLDLMLAGPEEK
ncbi:MAG: hypothetical protein AB7G15_15555 [Alphaproteobacteria bacterium]